MANNKRKKQKRGPLGRTATAPARPIPEPDEVSEERSSNPKPPWLVLVLAFGCFAVIKPEIWLTWSRDQAPAWAQTGALAVGLASIWLILRGLCATQWLGASRVRPTSKLRSTGQLVELMLSRTAICTLTGTFLALMVAGRAEAAGVKVTSLISDLATVGALVGLASCAPRSVIQSIRTFKLLKENDRRNWVRAHLTLAIVDLMVLFELWNLIRSVLFNK
ncbi:hypothetical protein SAMN05216215_100125 [Saccharopolyspora shandongensis]|uniref:Uncharacterized protein n=1 Tax=Saccharopolyspora shandongensis TaxID=418495 RepID=A0A1H2Q9B6_9PSEU|nr:hypothetical protein [Saccharopolyspora shandongensis]SDW03378.1 hypothetical protein SAMN05216215_100125 [Saccharopolyspora shandongensis]